MVNRRGFLAGLLATVPTVKYFFAPRGGWPTTSIYTYETKALGYAIDPRLVEYHEAIAQSMLHTKESIGAALYNRSHPPLGTAMGAILRPTLEEFWEKTYAEHSDEWTSVFNDSSLEEIEIGIERPTGSLGPADWLLEKERVAILPAQSFGPSKDQRGSPALVPRLPRIRKA